MIVTIAGTDLATLGYVEAVDKLFDDPPLRSSSVVIPGTKGQVSYTPREDAYTLTVRMVIEPAAEGALKTLIRGNLAPYMVGRGRGAAVTETATGRYWGGYTSQEVGATHLRVTWDVLIPNPVWT